MTFEMNYRFTKDNSALSMPLIGNLYIRINYKYLHLSLIGIVLCRDRKLEKFRNFNSLNFENQKQATKIRRKMVEESWQFGRTKY